MTVENQVLSSVKIQKLQSVEELEQVRELEAIVWSFDDSVPVNHTVTVVKNGGFILGAFYKNELIGFQYSFPGFDGQKVYLCSHSLGIHPDYRKLGIGEKLKGAQKQLAAEKGYELITWTYDPLETVNGNLNLHKLRAVCSTYIEDAYGEMDDGLNSGIPTDRFLVEWWVQEKQTSRISVISKLPCAIETSIKRGFLVPGKVDLNLMEAKFVIPVPGNFQEMKKADFSLALTWRKATRRVFTHFFNNGWQVTDLLKDTEIPNQYLYLVEKRG
jgi:predicted GNAT superfamily acetyltransferase